MLPGCVNTAWATVRGSIRSCSCSETVGTSNKACSTLPAQARCESPRVARIRIDAELKGQVAGQTERARQACRRPPVFSSTSV